MSKLLLVKLSSEQEAAIKSGRPESVTLSVLGQFESEAEATKFLTTAAGAKMRVSLLEIKHSYEVVPIMDVRKLEA